MKNDETFHVVSCDTDSILFSKRDGSFITEDERKSIVSRINSLYPTNIRFEDDGYFTKALIFKAKNYVLYDGVKTKIKGSALKDSKKEKGLKDFQKEIIQAILDNQTNYVEIYHKYVMEALSVQDIKRWASKKTITQKVLTNDRTNEVNIRNAIAGSDYREGDKAFMFFKEDGTLCLAENFTGEYDKETLLAKLFAATKLFTKPPKGQIKSILPAALFLNYSLKRNQKLLANLK